MPRQRYFGVEGLEPSTLGTLRGIVLAAGQATNARTIIVCRVSARYHLLPP